MSILDFVKKFYSLVNVTTSSTSHKTSRTPYGIQRTVHNSAEARFLAPQILKQAKDCARIVNTTKNPDVYFDRFDFLLDCLEKMVGIERFVSFKGENPKKLLSSTLNLKELNTNNFIKRYYEDTLVKIGLLKTYRAKENKVNSFYKNLSKYESKLTPDSALVFSTCYESLIAKLSECQK